MIDIVVVGGGASGLIAAISALRQGAQVCILERNERVGRKILATGNGRCNYTNLYMDKDYFNGKNNKFVYSGLARFGYGETIDFFESIGVRPYIDQLGRVYPYSLQSSSILDSLRMEIDRLKGQVKTNFYVSEIKKVRDGYIVKGPETIKARKIILACGGKVMANSGSDGSGYELAKSLGHSIEDIYPGLVQLKLENEYASSMTGVKILGRAYLMIDDRIIDSGEGDILFTDYGISGPTILDFSRQANLALIEGKDVRIGINLINQDYDSLLDYMTGRFNNLGYRTIEDSLVGLINKRLILPFLKGLEINKDKLTSQIKKEELDKICRKLIEWEFKVTGHNGLKNGQVTIGGVSTFEIDNQSYESKLHKGLYIVGELMDIDGECGGYNLQWAWTTGYLAGLEASKTLR